MLLNEIFAKDIQRPIEGVIKADDVAHLGTEVEEYVLTNEAAKGLESCSRRTRTTPTPTASGSPASSAPASRTCSRCSPTCSVTSKARSSRARTSPIASAPRATARSCPRC